MPEAGELFVGAYLRIVRDCPIVQYNARDHRQGSQSEVDVLGLDYAAKQLYVCEVVTHLAGALYSGKTSDETVSRIEKKFRRHRAWVARSFAEFPSPTFMLWSPYVAVGAKTTAFEEMSKAWPGPGRFECWINAAYADAMKELIRLAAGEEKQRGEEFYRVLQLLTHLRGVGNRRLDLRLD